MAIKNKKMSISKKYLPIMKLAFLIGITGYTGCTHGPVRHHTLGYYKYATSEFTKRSHWMIKPIALPTGLVTDTALILIDTAVTPIAAFFVPDSEINISKNEELSGVANLYIPSYPFTLANIGAMGIGAGSKGEYEDIFGSESSLFHDKPSKTIPPKTE